jgi:hypothetical protein
MAHLAFLVDECELDSSPYMSMTMRDSDAAMDGLRFPVLVTIVVITNAVDLHGDAAFAAAACSATACATA